MSDVVHVAYLQDNLASDYSRHTGTAMLSMLEYCSKHAVIHLFHEEILSQDNIQKREEEMNKFREMVSEYDAEIHFYNVTFPEDYAAELAGKDAVFTITINSVKGYSEFNDEFVEANLSNIALTADAFIDYYKNIKYQTALYSYIQKYVVENSTVKEYPKKYLKIVRKN